MAKRQLKPAVGLRPVPVIMVTCVDEEERANIITLAWTGVVCSTPPMLSIAVRPERFSHDLIERTGQFVVNLPSADQLWAADYCGTRSGRHEDKFASTGLSPIPAAEVRPPLIAECPINIECVVRNELKLGSHDLFIGEVVALHVDENALDEAGNPSAARAGIITYDQPYYWSLGGKAGDHGYSKSSRPDSSDT